MIESTFDDLPESPDDAFLLLETRFHLKLQEALDEAQERGRGWPVGACLEYMYSTLSAASELGIVGFADVQVPDAGNLDFESYANFRAVVAGCTTAVHIRTAFRKRGYSVRFDDKIKRKFSHYITQMNDIISRLEVDEWKRESMLSALAAFKKEVDTNRAPYDRFAAFVIETAGVVGAAAEKLEPLRRLIDSVAELIWGAKHAEQTRQVEPPPDPRQLPAPPKKTVATSKRDDMDDEIPF